MKTKPLEDLVGRIDTVHFAIEQILNGVSHSELVQLICAKDSVSEPVAAKIIITARKIISEDTLVEIEHIIDQHTEYYEQIFKYFDEVNFVPGKLKALKQKEKLLALHKEENVIEINNEVNVDIEQESQYDVNKLTGEEKKKLEQYMAKLK